MRAEKLERALATIRESLPELPVWVGGEWPRRQPFHGAEHADGVFPIHRDTDRFRPLTPAEAEAALRSLSRARVRTSRSGAGTTRARTASTPTRRRA